MYKYLIGLRGPRYSYDHRAFYGETFSSIIVTSNTVMHIEDAVTLLGHCAYSLEPLV